MLALGAMALNNSEDLDFAKDIAETCYEMYRQSPSRISAETTGFIADGRGGATLIPTSLSFPLRPGTVNLLRFTSFLTRVPSLCPRNVRVDVHPVFYDGGLQIS